MVSDSSTAVNFLAGKSRGFAESFNKMEVDLFTFLHKPTVLGLFTVHYIIGKYNIAIEACFI